MFIVMCLKIIGRIVEFFLTHAFVTGGALTIIGISALTSSRRDAAKKVSSIICLALGLAIILKMI